MLTTIACFALIFAIAAAHTWMWLDILFGDFGDE